MKEKLIALLEDIRPDVEFENEKKLIDDGVLDSFDIVTLVSKIDDEFDVEITPKDLIPENFATPSTIYDLIKISNI